MNKQTHYGILKVEKKWLEFVLSYIEYLHKNNNHKKANKIAKIWFPRK